MFQLVFTSATPLNTPVCVPVGNVPIVNDGRPADLHDVGLSKASIFTKSWEHLKQHSKGNVMNQAYSSLSKVNSALLKYYRYN